MIVRLRRPVWPWQSPSLPHGQFWVYFVVALFFNFGFSVFFFLFNLYLLGFGCDERTLGLIGSAIAVGTLCGTIPAGIAATRFGLKNTLIGGIVLACLASMLRVIFVPFAAQMLLAVFAGAGLCVWGVCLSPAVASLTTAKDRPTAFSITFASGIGVAGLGAFAAGHLPGFFHNLDSAHLSQSGSERLTLLFAVGVAALSLLPLSRLSLTDPEARRCLQLRFVRPSSIFLRQFLPAMAVWSLVTGALPPFANLFFVRHLGLSLEATGTVLSLSQLVQFGAILLAPVLFRFAGLRNGIIVSQLSTAAVLFTLATVHSASSAGMLYWGYMAAQCINEPGIYGLLMNRVAESDRSGASSYTFFIGAISQIVVSSAVGAMIVRLGYSPVLIVTASLAVVAALLFKRLANSASPAIIDDQRPMLDDLPIPTTSE